MIKEFDKVRIRKTGIVGVVVDIYTVNGNVYYSVESDERGVPGGYGEESDYKIFRCQECDLVKVKG